MDKENENTSKKDRCRTLKVIKTPYMGNLIARGLAQQDLKHN